MSSIMKLIALLSRSRGKNTAMEPLIHPLSIDLLFCIGFYPQPRAVINNPRKIHELMLKKIKILLIFLINANNILNISVSLTCLHDIYTINNTPHDLRQIICYCLEV